MESEVGQGAVIQIELPVAKLAAAAGGTKGMSKIRILLADDHSVMRSGLKLLLEKQSDFEVVGEADDGRQAVALAGSVQPDVVVIDVAMPNLNGIEATRQISAQNPNISIVILSMHSDEGYVLRAEERRQGYMLKESPEADFIQAVAR